MRVKTPNPGEHGARRDLPARGRGRGCPRSAPVAGPAAVFLLATSPRQGASCLLAARRREKSAGVEWFYLAKGKEGRNAPAGTGREDSEPPRVTPGGGQEEGGAGGKWVLV